MDDKEEFLVLKWGSLKRWNFGDWAKPLFEEYSKIGSSVSAIAQHDTPRQKEIICELIDRGDFKTVHLDWDGIDVTKKAAKKYILDYGKKSTRSTAKKWKTTQIVLERKHT